MNKIDKDELFRHFSGFLKARGIELQEGAYSQQIQKGCGLLAETVNLSQQAFERAKTEMERHLDQMRQVIHEQTAPRTRSAPPRSKPAAASTKTAGASSAGKKSPKAKRSRQKK